MTPQSNCPGCNAPLPSDSPEGLCPACLLRKGMAATQPAPESSSGWTPPDPQQLAACFPELDSIELIGRGGMGAVYRVRQVALDRVVALKILPPQLGAEPGFSERFTREAQAMARLNHPHIVMLYEFGQRQDFFFFIMEYIDGANLRHLIDSGGISPREAMAIIPQVCEALQFAHDNGIVHRDIKPENILLDRQGQVKIADFGLARITGGDAPQQATAVVMGTPYYMAPEQVNTPQAVDHRADIYSLGVVFYQLLTGELPIGRFEPPSHRVVVDVRLDEVVLRTLEKEPSRRYQQASEVKSRVETIAASPALGDHPGMVLGILLVGQRKGKVFVCPGGVFRGAFTLLTVYLLATVVAKLFTPLPTAPYAFLVLFFLMFGMIFRAIGLRADQLIDLDARPPQYPRQSIWTGWRTLLRIAHVRNDDKSVNWARLLHVTAYALGAVIVYIAAVRLFFWSLSIWPGVFASLLTTAGMLVGMPLGYYLASRFWGLPVALPTPPTSTPAAG